MSRVDIYDVGNFWTSAGSTAAMSLAGKCQRPVEEEISRRILPGCSTKPTAFAVLAAEAVRFTLFPAQGGFDDFNLQRPRCVRLRAAHGSMEPKAGAPVHRVRRSFRWRKGS